MIPLRTIKSILVGLNEDGRDEPSSALGYGLTLAGAASAHMTVQATSLRLRLGHALMSSFAAGVVATENRRVGTLAAAVAERAIGDAGAAGVACSVESLQLDFPALREALVAQARVHGRDAGRRRKRAQPALAVPWRRRRCSTAGGL